MKVVLDTNVLLAGLATRGLCEELVLLCFKEHEVALSKHILDEVQEHYQDKFKAKPQQIEAAVKMLKLNCEIVEPEIIPPQAFSDKDDLPVLGTALAAQADCIVTGDKKLAQLKKYDKVKILSPRQFYEYLRKLS